MLLRRYRQPLWVAVVLAPLAYNLVGIGIAAVGYAAIGRAAIVSILVVWIGSAHRLLAVIDTYKLSDSSRALALLGAVLWMIISFVLMVAAADAA